MDEKVGYIDWYHRRVIDQIKLISQISEQLNQIEKRLSEGLEKSDYASMIDLLPKLRFLSKRIKTEAKILSSQLNEGFPPLIKLVSETEVEEED